MHNRRWLWLFLVFAWSCDSPAEPPAGVSVSLTMDRSTAAPGDTVLLTVIAHNESDRLVLISSSSVCIAFFAVNKVDTERIPGFEPRICDLASVQHRLEPHGELVDRLHFVVPRNVLQRPPGEYDVRGGVSVRGYGLLWSPVQNLTITDR